MLIWINLEDKAKKMAPFRLNWSHLDVCEHYRTIFKPII